MDMPAGQAPTKVPSLNEDDIDVICTRDFRVMAGSCLLSFKRGQVVDDANTIRTITEAFPNQKPPIRKLNPLDLV